MSRQEEPAIFDQQMYEALWRYLHDSDAHGRAKQEQAALKVHADGWKTLATVVERGLAGIAEAIRRHN